MLKAKDNKVVVDRKAEEAAVPTPETKSTPLAAPAISKGVSKITRIDH